MASMTRQTFRIFIRHAVRYPRSIVLISIGIVITTVADIYKPILYRNLLNGVAGTETGDGSLLWLVTQIGLLGLFTQIVWRGMGFSNSNFQPRVMADLLTSSYERILRHSMRFFSDNYVGSIVNRIRRYPNSFETIDDQFKWNISRTVLRCIFVIAVLWSRFPIFAYIVLTWSLIYVVFTTAFSKYKMKYDIASADQDTRVTGFIADTIGNMSAIKAFAAEARELGSFVGHADKSFQLRRYAWRLGQWAELFQGVSMVVLEAIMFYVAVHNRTKLGLTVGDFALLQAYLVQVFDYLWDFGRYIRQTFEGLANANELTEMLEKPIEVVDAPGAGQLVVHRGEIDFRNVNFAYDGSQRLTLKDFNLHVPSGMRIALVGESGAGKSTIARLLLRFADVTSGGIYIDGMNISGVTQQSLRESIAVVSQDTALFHRTLLENIRYGRPEATDEEVIVAAKAAHCHEFISRLPFGYNTLVGERGVKLSGGERQRIAIARAILKDSQIVFLDEATSALDSESEALIQDALAHLMAGKTLLVIAHRLSTIREMDTIMVLSDGQVVESGSHDELLQVEGGRYRALWTKQSGGFIAAASPAEE